MTPNDFPAFPVPDACAYYPTGERKNGMTLRDWFAGMAMQSDALDLGSSIREAAECLGVSVADYDPHKHWSAYVARRCYALADAMMAEREKPCGVQS